MELNLTSEAKSRLDKIDDITRQYQEYLNSKEFDQNDFALNIAVINLGQVHLWARNSLLKKFATDKLAQKQ